MKNLVWIPILIMGIPCILNSCKKDEINGPIEVNMYGDYFSPDTVTVSKGSTIKWTNKDSDAHTVTSDDALFDSDDKNYGETYTRLFDSIGTFPYHCVHHSGMNGTVIVN